MLKDNKNMIALSLVAIFFISLDRLLKVLAFTNQDRQFNILGEVLKFSYKNNYYIAFSLPLSGAWLNAAIFLIILLLFFYLLKAIMSGKRGIALCLFAVALGAAGNLFDRLKYGYVIDYLDLKYFMVFNLDDIMIMVGIITFIWPNLFRDQSNSF